MAQKTVTVVIPTYNEEDYIAECLDAVFAQTVLPDEVIVVDNNSTDKTLDIVKKYKPVKIMKEQRQGQVFARLKAFSAAKSDWIVSLDADSVIDPTFIEEMMRHSSVKKQVFSSHVYTEEGSFRRLVIAGGNFFFFTVNKLISGQELVLGSNFVISSKLWNQVKPDLRLRTDLWEDLDIGLIANSKGYKTSLVQTRNVRISIRFSTIGFIASYKRLLGWPKTYWPYNKPAAILSIFFAVIALLSSVICRYTIYLFYRPQKKYYDQK